MDFGKEPWTCCIEYNIKTKLFPSRIFPLHVTEACRFLGKTTAEERRLFRAGQAVERWRADRKDGTSTLTGNERSKEGFRAFRLPLSLSLRVKQNK